MEKKFSFIGRTKLTLLIIFISLFSFSAKAWYCYPSYSTGTCTAFGGPYNINAIRIGSKTLAGLTCTNNGVDTTNLSSSFPIYIGKSTYYRLGCAATEKYAIYIDFNDDQDFDDAGEFILSVNTATSNPNGNFTLAASTSTTGKHRMRIRSGVCNTFFCTTTNFSSTRACSTYGNGSTVDVIADVKTPKAFDVEINSISGYFSDCGIGSQKLTFGYTNFGTDSILKGDTLNFGFSVNGSTPIIDTQIVASDIAPNGTGTFTFSTGANFSTSNTNYTIEGFNATKTDSNSANDTVYAYNRNRIVINKFPWKENFDGSLSSLPTDWVNDQNNGGYGVWFLSNTASPTPNTGPDNDHTTGSGNFMFLEDGGAAVGGNLEFDSVILTTPCLDISKLRNPTMEFWVHSQDSGAASTDNELYIDVLYNGKLYKNLVDPTTGIKPRGNYWFKRTLDLSKYPGIVKVRFRGDLKNGSNANDIAIDDIRVFEQFSYDLGATAINNPISGDCGDSMTKVNISIKNYGIKSVSKVPVTAIFKNASGTQTLIDTFRRTLTSGMSDTFTFSKRIITYNGGTYNVTIATLYGDSATVNDTLLTKVGINGAISAIPSKNLKSTSVCFNGSVKIYIDSVTGYNVFWYDSKTSNTAVGVGDTFTTPALNFAKTFYSVITTQEVYNTAIKLKSQAVTGTGGDFPRANWPQTINGNTVNAGLVIDAKKGFYIDSISVFPGGSGYVVVNLEDSTGKLIKKDSFTVTGSSSNPEQRVKLGMYVPKGKSYRLTAAGSTVSGLYRMTVNSLPISVSNIMSIKDNTFNYAGNTGAAGRYYFFYNLRITGDGCAGPRTPVNADIRRGVPGAGFTAGKPFNGKAAILSGTNDTISAGDTSIFIYNTPTGLTNADFNIKWSYKNISLASLKGAKFTDSMFKATTTSANGTMRFTPSIAWGDSTIKWTVVYSGTGLCDTTITRTIYISPKPKAGFSTDTVCAATPTNFINKSVTAKGVLSSSWDFGDGKFGTGNSPSHNYLTGGTYRAKLKVTSSNGSSDTTSMMIVVKNQPISKFGASSTCLGSATQFNDSSKVIGGSIASYNWDFGDKSSPKFNANPSYTYASPKTYSVTLIATSNLGCSDTVVQSVDVNALPNPSFVAKTLCALDSLKINNTSTILLGSMNYNWKFGDNSKDTAKMPIHIYANGGTYSITLVATSDKGCVDSVKSAIVIKHTPNAKYGVVNYCLNQNAVFLDSTTISSGGSVKTLNWDFGDGFTFTGAKPKHAYSSKGTVTTSLKATSTDGCISNYSMNIDVIDGPTALFTKKVDSNQITLTATSLGNKYLWKFGDGDSSMSSPAVHKYAVTKGNTKVFNLSLVVMNSIGCMANSNDTVSISVVNGVQEFTKVFQGFSIYPNPMKEIINLEFTSLLTYPINVSIKDISGKLLGTVYSGKTVTGRNNINLNVSQLTPGLYFIQLEGNSIHQSFKVIKN